MESPIVVEVHVLSNGAPLHVFAVDQDTKYTFTRAAGYVVYETEHHTGGVNKAIDAAGLPKPVLLRRNSLPPSITYSDYDTLLAAFHQFQLFLDPACARVAKMISIVPLSTVQVLALSQGSKEVLESLDMSIPKEWVLEQKQDELKEEGLVDLELDEQIDELKEVALLEELAAFEPYQEEPDDEGRHDSYTLKRPCRQLQLQLQAYLEFKTKKFVFNRVVVAVEQTTAEADIKTILRFLGWLQISTKVRPTCLSDLRSTKPELAQGFCAFLLDRPKPIACGSLANYFNR